MADFFHSLAESRIAPDLTQPVPNNQFDIS
jgi:hypothetical protein